MARTSTESPLPELSASIAVEKPRVLVLSAPAGYGKGTLLRRYAKHAGGLVTCDLPTELEGADLARPILDALVAEDRRRAERSAADRLAQRRELAVATSRETLRREWPRAENPELFVLRDICGALATPAGADLFAELVGALPTARTLAVSTRNPLPPALNHIAARETMTTIGPADLAMTRAEVADLVSRHRGSAKVAAALYELTHGWPLVTRLLVRLLQYDTPQAILDDARALPGPSLLSFAAHRTIANLKELTREALIVTALLRVATHSDLIRVLGDGCDDVVFAQLSELPFVILDEAGVVIHPEIVGLLRARFGSLVRPLFDRTLDVLTGDGAYAEAARVAVEGGDIVRAAAIIDAAPPYTAAPVLLGEYERIIDRIDRRLITRFPNVWIATIPYRSFAVDRASFVREAETVYYCLPHSASSDQRATALMLLASAYTNVGRFADSDQLLEEALQGFARERTLARASLLNFSASLRGMEGRFTLARYLAEEAASMSRDRFGEMQTLHYIDAHEAAFRGRGDRAVVIVDELLRRLQDEDLPLHFAHTATNGALFAWVNDDDESFQRYIAMLEEALTPGLERGFAPMIDAARGRSMRVEDNYPWPVIAAVAQLYRLEMTSGVDDALDAARAAVRAADERRDPYVQVLAHTALYVLDEAARIREATALAAIVAGVESPEMCEAVAALVRGEPAGILERFVRRRVLRERKREHGSSQLRVELLSGRLVVDSVPVRLSDKEFELLALLGSAHGALSRDRIGEALWNHLDPEEWSNNLKVTLSRLRRKLGTRDVVGLVEGRYRLSPMIDVDLRRAEAVMRQYGTERLNDTVRAAFQAILDGYRNGAVSRYEHITWMQPLLARINELVCMAGIGLANDALMHGQYNKALAFASEAVEADPFNEAACEVIVRVLLARGDLDAARRAFRRHATALAEELGATPSTRLTELIRGPA